MTNPDESKPTMTEKELRDNMRQIRHHQNCNGGYFPVESREIHLKLGQRPHHKGNHKVFQQHHLTIDTDLVGHTEPNSPTAAAAEHH